MLCHCDLCSQTLKSSAVYQLRGVRTYAIGDVHGRADLLAQLFAGINDDTAAYPVEMFRRAGDSGVLRIGTVHQSGQTGTVGTRGGAQSGFAGRPSPLSRAPTQVIRLRDYFFVHGSASRCRISRSRIGGGSGKTSCGTRKVPVRLLCKDTRRWRNRICAQIGSTSTPPRMRRSACTATAASRRSVRCPTRCDIRNAAGSGGRTHKFTLFTHAMRSGPDLRSANMMAQGLNLKRELYCPVSKFQILCFQSFEQVPALAHFSAVGIGSRAGRAGPRKLVNGSGFLLVKEASASYHTHRKLPRVLDRHTPDPDAKPTARSPILNRIAQSEMRAIVDLTSEPRYKGHNAQHGCAFRTAPSHRVTKRKTSRPPTFKIRLARFTLLSDVLTYSSLQKRR
jgi:hypothetical protein